MDIQNTASFSGKSIGVTAGLGKNDKNPAGNFNPQGSSVGTGSASDSAQSVSKAAISGIAGDKAARTGNAETGLKPIFDRTQVEKDIAAQAAITGSALSQGASAWGGYANKKYADAVKNGDADAQACWGPTGGCRASGHALIGALGGGVAGGIAAGATSTLAPRMQEFLVQQGLPPQAAAAAVSAAATAAGGALGGSAGAGAAFNEAANNFVPGLLLAVPAAIVTTGGAAACMSTPSCVRVLQLGGTAAVDYVASTLTLEQLSKVPGILSVVGPALRLSLQTVMGLPTPPLVPGTPPIAGNTGNQSPAPNYGHGTTSPGTPQKQPTNTTTPAGTAGGSPTTSPGVPLQPQVITISANGQQQQVSLPSLVEPDRAVHILTGDSWGGGHLWPGKPGKTPFPSDWGPDKILGAISDIATDPFSTKTPAHSGGRVLVNGKRDGVDILVVLEPNGTKGGRIVTAFPTNLPRNP